MSTGTKSPPSWAEALLERLLSAHERETVVGDLREEYTESVVVLRGRLLADLWYLRQIWSFVTRRLFQKRMEGQMLHAISFFTFACASWLATMEMLLRHHGYELRIVIALCIALISLATILGRLAPMEGRNEGWRWAGALVLIGIGGQAFLHNVRAAHFEGFVVVISLVLVVQGVLLLFRRMQKGGTEYVV
jgi:hypothetical protein